MLQDLSTEPLALCNVNLSSLQEFLQSLAQSETKERTSSQCERVRMCKFREFLFRHMLTHPGTDFLMDVLMVHKRKKKKNELHRDDEEVTRSWQDMLRKDLSEGLFQDADFKKQMAGVSFTLGEPKLLFLIGSIATSVIHDRRSATYLSLHLNSSGTPHFIRRIGSEAAEQIVIDPHYVSAT